MIPESFNIVMQLWRIVDGAAKSMPNVCEEIGMHVSRVIGRV